MAGVATDVNPSWTLKQPALRTNLNLDLSTAISLRIATVLASASSTSVDYTTRIRDYYADALNTF